jgi:hypothetical protein
MIDLMGAIRRALRDDPLIKAVVGQDADTEVKVYSSVGKPDVQAPYIVFGLIPGPGPIGTYGRPDAWEPFTIQTTSWGRTPQEAWSVADILDDAIVSADYVFEPGYLARVARVSTPEELPDRDTNLRQVVVQYEFKVGR